MRVATIAAVALVVVAGAPSAAAAPPPEPRGGGRTCNAIKVNGTPSGQIRSIIESDSGWAASHIRRLGRTGALWITIRGQLTCQRLRGQLAQVLLARGELVALRELGFAVRSVDRLRVDGAAVHRVTASRRGARISYVRPGGAARVDRSTYRAGQEIGFDRTRTTCTSAFVLRLRASGRLAGLSAGHCSAGPTYAPPQYPGGPPIFVTDTVMRRGAPLGPVFANLNMREPGPDGLLFELSGVRHAAQEIDRRGGTPHRVTGVLPRSRQRMGRVVCFTGATSGVDRCGRIDGASTWFGRRVVCARSRSRAKLSDHGDSGGAVYTRPIGGRVRAVGIVSRSSIGGRARDMCFTPIQDLLDAFGARLPTGSFAIAAG